MVNLRSVLLTIAAIALGYAASTEAVPPVIASSDRAQHLPIEAQVRMGDRQFDLEIARTDREQSLGLMFRDPLPAGRGMMFPFEPAQDVSFWMYNVRIPLDMVFIREGEVVYISESAPGCTTLPCPSYGPPKGTPIDGVLEFNGGTTAQVGLAVGDRLAIHWLE